jgi:Tfp pilus assembly protein PilN
MKAVNLIPSEQRAGGASLAGSSEGGAFIVLGLMAGLAILALLYGMAHHHIASRSGEVAVLSSEAASAQAQANKLAPYTSFVAMHDQRQQAISQLVESRFDWAHAFHELGRVLPFDVSLSSVHGTAGSSSSSSAPAPAAGAAAASTPVASATPPGTAPVFTIVGCATSQSEVAKTLDRLRLIDGVTAVELQSSAKAESGGGAGSSTCPAQTDPSFTAQITFAPLPTPSSTASTTPAGTAATAAATTSTSTSSSTSTSTTSTATGGS